ncbi:hypothetical protein M513_00743, partial [Trichuris suis]
LEVVLFINLATRRSERVLTTNFTLAFCAGQIFVLVGTSCAIIHRIVKREFHDSMTAWDCFAKVPNVLLYSIGEPILAFTTMLMALDFHITLCVVHPAWKLTGKKINVLIISALLLGALNALLTFIIIYARRDVSVDAACDQAEVMDPFLFRAHYYTMAACGAATAVIYGTTAKVLLRHKSKYSVIRIIQLRRQAAVMKHTAIVVSCTFVSQTIPNLAAAAIPFEWDPAFQEIVFFVYLSAFAIPPVYMFCRKFTARRRLLETLKSGSDHTERSSSRKCCMHMLQKAVRRIITFRVFPE